MAKAKSLGMGYDLGSKQSPLRVLASPGPVMAVLGLLVLLVAVSYFKANSPGGDLDALIEAQAHSGPRLKSMIGMVAGVLMCLGGALWSVMTFTQGRR